MTAPRQVLRGTTYLVSRRCTQRTLLLRPSRLTNEFFHYVLAVAAQRYGVQVHAYCVLSNHFHLVVTDPLAQLPRFQQFLDGLVARALNARHGRWEHFWAPSSYSAVRLATPDDIVAKAAYTLANPVAAGLVRRGQDWPGLWSAPASTGTTLQLQRPDHFFSTRSLMPKTIGLRLEVPPGFGSAEAYRARLEPCLADLEAEAMRETATFLGAKRVLAQRPFSRPAPGEPRRRLNPRVAARDKWKRIELLGMLKEFLAAYRDALAAWREKRTNPVFPAGTYLMRVAHGVACADTG